MVSLRPEELRAAGCVQSALPGVTVGQHDDNTAPSMHDLDLSIGGTRTFGAMEVTMAADRDLIPGLKLLSRWDEPRIVPGLIGQWVVWVSMTARNIKLLPLELPSLLLEVEKVGFTDELIRKAAELGIAWAQPGGTKFPGSISVVPELPPHQAGGAVASTGDALSEWISKWIIEPLRSDNLRKLQRSAVGERHLFVIIPGFGSMASFPVTDLLMRTDAPLPTVNPQLPSEITHVWVMGTWAAHGFRWSPDQGWKTFASNAELDPSKLGGCMCRLANV